MKPLTEQVHDLLRSVVQPGDIAIDATAGNGHDTLFLAEQVGPAGAVYAFDIQPAAIAATRRRLAACDVRHVTLIQTDHARMCDEIPRSSHGRVGAIMFNLGYLPGEDRAIVTQPGSTIPAISSSLELLKPGGRVTIVVYRGHTGGEDEAGAVLQFVDGLDAERIACRVIDPHSVKRTPFVVVLESLDRRETSGR